MEQALDRVQHRFVTVDDVRTHYIEAGAGVPVLLIHGLGSSVIAWRDNLLPLAEHFKVYAMDLPGHGDSEKPPSHYDLAGGLGFLEKFLDTLGIDRAHLVGESMGGLLVIAFGLRRPERVRKVIAIGAAGLGKDLSWAIRALTVPGVGELITHPSMRSARYLLKRVMSTKKKISDPLVKEVYRVHAPAEARRAMLRIARWGVSPMGLKKEAYLLPELPTLKPPLMLVWGANDSIAPVKHGYQAAKVLPSARLEVFEQCGHWAQMEHSERFNPLALEFLQASEHNR